MTNENISVTEVQNENSVIAERRAKLLKLREHGVAYPNDFATIRGQCSISSKKARWAKPLTQISRRSTSATSLLVKVR